MATIGVFDSGVGGLWILRHLKDAIPSYSYVFFGDQAHVPYGSRSLDEIRRFSEEITNFLINNKDCKVIVIACNTASAASLKYLRDKFKDVSFVGMEPAIKPAVESTITKKVGVLATPATFQGELYNSVVERFAQDVEIFKDTCSGLVEQIEKGELESKEIYSILNKAISPMMSSGIDTIVLGCTHYPFVIPQIKKITGGSIRVIDPTEAIVRQVTRILNENKIEISKNNFPIEIFTSGNPKTMQPVLNKLFDSNEFVINKLNWVDGELK